MSNPTSHCDVCGDQMPADSHGNARRCSVECRKEAKRRAAAEKYWADPQAMAAKNKEYYAENRSSILDQKREYYAENAEDIREYKRQYRGRHPERQAAADRKYHATHRAQRSAANRAWRAANREHLVEYEKARYAARRGEASAYHKLYYQENKEKLAEYQKHWRSKNQDKIDVYRQRRSRRLAEAFVAPVVRSEIFERDNWKCHLCGKKVDREAKYPAPGSATIDHIIPLAKGGTHEPANVALAHARCNVTKQDGGGGEQLAII